MGWLWDNEKRYALNYEKISIPLWDDCEDDTTKKTVVVIAFQFHYGMIVRMTSTG